MHRLTALGAVGSATPAMHCLAAWGQWAVQLQLLQSTASLPGGSGQCNSCNALPHCLGAVGSATPTPAMHCLTAWGQWAVQLLQCTASLPWGSRQCNSCNAPPHCLGAVGSATPAMHCLTAPGAVDSATPAMHCLTVWRRRRRRSACRGPTYGEPWRRPSGAKRRLCRGSPPSYLR